MLSDRGRYVGLPVRCTRWGDGGRGPHGGSSLSALPFSSRPGPVYACGVAARPVKPGGAGAVTTCACAAGRGGAARSAANLFLVHFTTVVV